MAEKEQEAEQIRQQRFGQLPERVMPDDLVELVEVDPPRDVPEPKLDPTGVWNIRYV